MQAVILAGGKGSRLKPFTTNIPKPLIPIDDLPIVEVILRQLEMSGFTRVTLAVNHLAELMMAFFKDGKDHNLEINYSREEEPLGTAGPLKMVKDLNENFLVMNGDLLTTLNYKKLFQFHVDGRNDATIALYKKEVKIDLGVVKTDDTDFVDYIEKPSYTFDVSMGIYMFNKSVLEYIPNNERFDIPNLMLNLKAAGKKVQCYKGDYFWLDIGRVSDYDEAVSIFRSRRDEFLPRG